MPTHVTERYATVQARLPRDLLEAVQRYASQHRCTVSELIRDGLQWRIEQDTPGRLWSQDAAHDPGEGATGADVLHVLHAYLPEMQRTLQELRADVRHVLHTHDARQTETSPDVGHVLQEHDVHTGQPSQDVRHVLHHGTGEQVATLPFDTTKFYLGRLCPKGHDYAGTGQSLLRRHNQSCRECENQAKRAKRVQRRTAARPEG